MNQPKYRSVLITGGTRGIGQAAVYAFARAGYRVAFCYKDSEECAAQITAQLSGEGLAAAGFLCDVSDAADLERLCAQTKKTFGTIDTLVNNACIAHKGLLIDETDESVGAALSVNLKAAINLCRLYTPDMIRSGFGRIVNVSSVFGQTGAACESVYAAAKGGIDAFTKSLAKELGLSGITVNAVSPGFIDTDMNRELSKKERAEFLQAAALNRAGTPEEVAALMLFLASDSASYITGQIIGVNGGM